MRADELPRSARGPGVRCARFGIPLAIAVLAVAGPPPPAGAGYYEFTGTIAIGKKSFGIGVPDLTVSGSGVGFSSGVSPNQVKDFHDVVGFTGSATTMTGFGQTFFLTITGIGSPMLSGTPMIPTLHGPMPVRGQIRMRTSPFAPIVTIVPLSSMGNGLGAGGTLPAAPADIDSFMFGTWSHAASETDVIDTVGALGTIHQSGTDVRAATGMGAVQLVTPTRVHFATTGPPTPDLAFLTTLDLNFAPEPGRAALLGSGALLLFLLGARSRSRGSLSGLLRDPGSRR